MRVEIKRKLFLAYLSQAIEDLGENISYVRFSKWAKDNEMHIPPRTVTSLFGSWSNAKEALGIDGKAKIRRKNYLNKEEIRKILRKANSEVKGALTQSKYTKWTSENKEISYITILSYFDSWNEAKEYAGLPIYKAKRGTKEDQKYSNEHLIEILRRANKEIEGKLTHDKYEIWRKENETPSCTFYSQRFSSWKEAKRVAGIE
ncbi:hypothetical protein AB0Y20_01035 [Heyndrickxia oleronia]|uniref:homing endonuclease associated repeat-containing protein n=1 Tax=Heyndrickxia oleronia TaxID=38875 RepID=UPI003F2609DD